MENEISIFSNKSHVLLLTRTRQHRATEFLVSCMQGFTEGSPGPVLAVPPLRYRTFGKELCAGSWLPLAYHRRPQDPRPMLQSTARSRMGRERRAPWRGQIPDSRTCACA